MNILVVTDNEYLYKGFKEIIKDSKFSCHSFSFAYSHKNMFLRDKYGNDNNFYSINIKQQVEELIVNYELIISLHCKQIFPSDLVKNKRCVNIHPGYNPYNRGWFPQVFSIINKMPVGVTIHEMDEQLDHGPIIVQEQVDINSWETSKDVYNKILQKELELINKYLDNIIENKYTIGDKAQEGNINYLKDFNKLCKLDLNEKLTMGEAIDKLRALTFEGYKNAYFLDDKNNKIWITLKLEKQ